MAIQGIITNTALSNFILAENNEGFLIHPTTFSISEITSSLDPTRTVANGGVWYSAPVSSRVVVDYNTVKFICTIPPGALPPATFKFVREIYVYGVDPFAAPFLMVIGQPSTAILYDPSGSITLELEISLTNVDLSSVMVFNFTQATEIAEHNLDCNAHPEYITAMNKAGIIVPCGGVPFDYLGQSFDEKAEFAGTKASFTHGGITFTATHNGTELNTSTITFDNIKTTDQIRAAFNAINPKNTVEHDDFTGIIVLPAIVKTLIGGTYLVDEKDIVYRDVDGLYKQALADGTITSKVSGMAFRSERIVRSSGFLTKTTGFTIGEDLYLSGSNPGKIVNTATSTKLGIQVGTSYILMGSQGGGGAGGGGSDFDAIVSDIAGFKVYSTTQAAIAATPDGGRILVDKVEYVENTIDPGTKRIDFWFNGPEAGWSKYLGTAEAQHLAFTGVPTSGTWRIEWNGYETIDLAYNATALDVQNAVNDLLNIFPSPEDFSDVSWTKTNATIATDVILAPNGTMTADKLAETNAIGTSHISNTFIPEIQAYAISVYVKADELDTFEIKDFTEGGISKTFDVTTGTMSGSDFGTISNSAITFITSGWYRCSATWTPTTTVSHTVSPVTIVGDLNDGFSGLYVWGAQLEIGVLTPYTGPITVVGDYSLGFDLSWASLVNVPQITFNHAGFDEVQQITFGNIPDDGTIKFDFDGQNTANLAWNDDAPLFETYLQALSNISDVSVTGSFNTQQFTVQWTGVDGKTPKSELTIVTNVLELGITPTTAAITTIQEGKYPASNLKVGILPVAITVTTTLGGSPVGPGTCFQVRADYTRFIGLGVIENFDYGINLNGYTGTDIEMKFSNVIYPTVETGLSPNIDYHTEKSFGLDNRRVIRNVGTFGDHLTLWSAVSAANNGDKIFVFNDQTLLTNQIINKEVEIEFVHGAQINVPGVLSGSLVTLGNKTKTKHMKIVISDAGLYDTVFLLDGSRGYHEDLAVESSNASVTITNAFEVNIGATAIFCHGVLTRGTSIITNGFVNTSGYGSHDIIIRDIEGGVILTTALSGAPVQEVPVGIIDGSNDTFTISLDPGSPDNLFVMIDGIQRRKSTWNLTGTTLTILSDIPKLGQQLDVFYIPAGTFFSPPRQLEILDNGLSQLFNTKKINFGVGLTVTVDSSEQVTIDATGGGGSDLTNITVDIQPQTDGAKSVGTSTKRWKDIFLKDKTTGDTWRIEVDNGVLQAVLVP